MSDPARRAPMVAGNWKMNTTIDEGVTLARAVAERCSMHRGVDVAVLPPFPHLRPVHDVVARTPVLLGAQDVFWEDRGAYTGEVSATMLAGWCDLVLVGHSERRHQLGETDEQSGRKLAAALRHRLRAILAVGETEAEHDAGSTLGVIGRQLSAALEQLEATPDPQSWLVAYEPVWAIGTGRTATPQQAEEVCAHIRTWVAEATSRPAPRVLYGGSVTRQNAADLFAQPSIDGGLVGGASLEPEAFAAIVAAAAEALAER